MDKFVNKDGGSSCRFGHHVFLAETSKGGGFSSMSKPTACSSSSGGGFGSKPTASSSSGGGGFGSMSKPTASSSSRGRLTSRYDIADGATNIPKYPWPTLRFTNEKEHLTTIPCFEALPAFVHHVEFDESCACITNIDSGRNFLRNCPGLETVDLTNFIDNLESTGNYFLSSCPKLHSVRGFRKNADTTSISIGTNFCSETALENIDLSPFAHLESIPDEFLKYATKLKEVDLRQFQKLKSIGEMFLFGCQQLESLQLPAVSDETNISVGTNFCNSTALENIDLSRFAHWETIPNGFLNNAKKLKEVDLRQFRKLKSIGNWFLVGCTDLECIHFPAAASITVGKGFCLCTKLRSIDLSFMKNNGQRDVPEQFLYRCRSLTSVDLTPLSEVETIREYFLSECESLTSVDLRCLQKIRKIERHFMSYCYSLRVVDFPPVAIPGLAVDDILCGCSALPCVDLRFAAGASTPPGLDGLKNLKIIGVPPLNSTESTTLNKLPRELHAKFVPIELGNPFECQWSWNEHYRHPPAIRLAVLWLFTGLQYQHATSTTQTLPTEVRCLPGEVAYEICRYIGTPYNNNGLDVSPTVGPKPKPRMRPHYHYGEGFASKPTASSRGGSGPAKGSILGVAGNKSKRRTRAQ